MSNEEHLVKQLRNQREVVKQQYSTFLQLEALADRVDLTGYEVREEIRKICNNHRRFTQRGETRC